MASGWVHTVHSDGAWLNDIEGEGGYLHWTRAEAVAVGRELAERSGTAHVIHNLDGTIAASTSYARPLSHGG